MLNAITDGRAASSGLYASTSARTVASASRAASNTGRRIHDVDERAGAFEVAEEFEAEPRPMAGALDETGHVGKHKRVPALQLGDTEIRMESRERVGGDLRVGSRQRRQQRRLATVRQPDQPDVRDEPELEMQVTLLSGVAQLPGAGSLARGGGEACVAPTAAAPARRQCHRSGPVEVGEHILALTHDRPHRDVQAQVSSVMTGALAATAGATILRNEGTAFAEPRERRVG